jgi:chromosome segregation ATPase
MKAFLQNLLIFFSLCLCGLIAFQWHRETRLHKKLQEDADVIHEKAENIQSLQQTVKRDEAEIQRLDALQKQLSEIVKSNNVELAQLRKDLKKVEAENERNVKQAEQYKEAFETANNRVVEANEKIKSLGEQVNNVLARHSLMVSNLNDMTQLISTMATDWNRRNEDMQKMKPAEQGGAAVTNLMALAKDFSTFVTRWNDMQRPSSGSRPAPAPASTSGTNAPTTKPQGSP